MATATEFSVQLEDRPGTLAELLEILGNAGVNVEGFGGAASAGKATLMFVPDNPDRAGQALDAAGKAYTKRDVLVLAIPNEPGAGARMARALANEGVNITGGFVLFGNRVTMATDNLAKTEEVARRMGAL